jgi:hypothetical protein
MEQLENNMLDAQSRKEYTEARVPELIRQGKTPNQAIAEVNSMWEALASEEMEVSYEKSLEFTAEITSNGFKGITNEESLFPDKSFAELFAMFGCEPGKRYEIEICIEEV